MDIDECKSDFFQFTLNRIIHSLQVRIKKKKRNQKFPIFWKLGIIHEIHVQTEKRKNSFTKSFRPAC
jgi:hypothetical protein